MSTAIPSVACGVVLAFLLGCSEPVPVAAPARSPLVIDVADFDFDRNPELLETLIDSPHRYFRFINIPFSREICNRYGDLIAGTPLFNLHGDAHIEQYAVTDLGRGLTDFDDSSSGPAIIDLLRFGVSVRVACQGHDCGDLDAQFDQFLRGYRAALNEPELEAPEPSVARRLRAGFAYDREAYLEWVTSVMQPMPEEERVGLARAMAPYVETMLAEEPERAPSYYDLVEAGYLGLGVGSALDRKYLIRTRGESDGPLDDAVLEAKEVREIESIECIRVAKGADPFRVLLGQTRIAYEPFGHLGYIRFRDRSFWIHAWVENYKEVEIGESFETPEELSEVMFDVGVQLGRGHANQIGAPLDAQLRSEQLRILDRDQEEMEQAVRDLTAEVLRAWNLFRSAQRTEHGEGR